MGVFLFQSLQKRKNEHKTAYISMREASQKREKTFAKKKRKNSDGKEKMPRGYRRGIFKVCPGLSDDAVASLSRLAEKISRHLFGVP